MTVLALRKLSVRYGGVRALVDVDLDVGEGELVGLIGANGAGKTTLIDAVTGFTPATGSVVLGESELLGTPPHRRVEQGLSRTWQTCELFDDLTVAEHISLAARRPTAREVARALVTGRARHESRVDEVLTLLGITDLADHLPEHLTTGQQRLVGVARALAPSPRCVCLDEPAAGLDSSESAALGEELRSVVRHGTSLLLVDHDMALVLDVCDHVVVLGFGQVIARGTPAEIRADERVIEAYLGASESGTESEHPSTSSRSEGPR